MRLKPFTRVAVVALAVTAFAACGDDDDDSPDGTEAPGGTEEPSLDSELATTVPTS